MTSLFAHRPSDRPPQREDFTAGATMSVIAHAALVAALVWGVHWRTTTTEGVTAELWSSVPQFAAPAPTSPPPQPEAPAPKPAPVPPPPAPPPPVAAPKPPDIVTEQQIEKLRKQEQQKKDDAAKAEKLKQDQQKAEAEKADKQKQQQQQKLDAQKLAKQHDDYMKRVLGQLDAPPNSAGTAAHNSGPTANWSGKVNALIRSHLVWTDTFDGLQQPEVSITLAIDGTILSSQLAKSSGNPRFDEALLRAIEGAHKLPRDVDGRVPSSVIIVYNPKG
jgi:colicin import membrane protein